MSQRAFSGLLEGEYVRATIAYHKDEARERGGIYTTTGCALRFSSNS